MPGLLWYLEWDLAMLQWGMGQSHWPPAGQGRSSQGTVCHSNGHVPFGPRWALGTVACLSG